MKRLFKKSRPRIRRRRRSMRRRMRDLRSRWDRWRRRWKRLARRARNLARRARNLARNTRDLARNRVAQLALAALALAVAALALASSCGGPPDNPENLCAIFEEKRSWYRAAKRSFEEWGVPEAVTMSVIYQESSFRRRVRPPRRRILWIFPGPRPSSAYGYGQVVEATWSAFQASTGRRDARRDDLADVVHFVGWYGERIHQATGLAKDDAFGLYLAYHEGPRGYLLGRHRQKEWLLDAAGRVETRALRYQRQYDGCRRRLDRWWIFW